MTSSLVLLGCQCFWYYDLYATYSSIHLGFQLIQWHRCTPWPSSRIQSLMFSCKNLLTMEWKCLKCVSPNPKIMDIYQIVSHGFFGVMSRHPDPTSLLTLLLFLGVVLFKFPGCLPLLLFSLSFIGMPSCAQSWCGDFFQVGHSLNLNWQFSKSIPLPLRLQVCYIIIM